MEDRRGGGGVDVGECRALILLCPLNEVQIDAKTVLNLTEGHIQSARSLPGKRTHTPPPQGLLGKGGCVFAYLNDSTVWCMPPPHPSLQAHVQQRGSGEQLSLSTQQTHTPVSRRHMPHTGTQTQHKWALSVRGGRKEEFRTGWGGQRCDAHSVGRS